MLTFEKCIQLWNSKKRKKGAVLIAPNTWLVNELDIFGEGKFVIRYYQTEILEFHHDGKIIYNSNGWRTHSLKNRFNKFGPEKVFQKNFIWYISGVPFEDGHLCFGYHQS